MTIEAMIPSWLLARQRLLVVTDAAHTYCDFIPAQGHAYKLLWAAGSHNDPLARDCQFTMADALEASNSPLQNLVSRATNVLHPLYDGLQLNFPAQIKLRLNHSLRFYVPLAAAGTVITVALLVEEFFGEDAFSG